MVLAVEVIVVVVVVAFLMRCCSLSPSSSSDEKSKRPFPFEPLCKEIEEKWSALKAEEERISKVQSSLPSEST